MSEDFTGRLVADYSARLVAVAAAYHLDKTATSAAALREIMVSAPAGVTGSSVAPAARLENMAEFGALVADQWESWAALNPDVIWIVAWAGGYEWRTSETNARQVLSELVCDHMNEDRSGRDFILSHIKIPNYVDKQHLESWIEDELEDGFGVPERCVRARLAVT
jgi:hypothetical protein